MIISFILIQLPAVMSTLTPVLLLYVFFPVLAGGEEITFLLLTNSILGLAVVALACCMFCRVTREMFKQRRETLREREKIKNLLKVLSNAGITMQNGGENRKSSDSSSEV